MGVAGGLSRIPILLLLDRLAPAAKAPLPPDPGGARAAAGASRFSVPRAVIRSSRLDSSSNILFGQTREIFGAAVFSAAERRGCCSRSGQFRGYSARRRPDRRASARRCRPPELWRHRPHTGREVALDI